MCHLPFSRIVIVVVYVYIYIYIYIYTYVCVRVDELSIYLLLPRFMIIINIMYIYMYLFPVIKSTKKKKNTQTLVPTVLLLLFCPPSPQIEQAKHIFNVSITSIQDYSYIKANDLQVVQKKKSLCV